MELTKVEFQKENGVPTAVAYNTEPRMLSFNELKDIVNKLIDNAKEIRDAITKKKPFDFESYLKNSENSIGANHLYKMNKDSYNQEDKTILGAKLEYLNEIIRQTIKQMQKNVRHGTN